MSKYLVATAIFWCLTFIAGRLIFIGLNSIKAVDVPISELAAAIVRGCIFDLSLWGYLSLVACVLVAALGKWLGTLRVLKFMTYLTGIIAAVTVFLLPAEAITYGAWGHHVDAPSLLMVAQRPSLILASSETWFEVAYVLVCAFLVAVDIWFLNKMKNVALKEGSNDENAISAVAALIVGGAMIIPIRGGFGLAPLNTGRAFTSNYIFANHVAINPLWNFIYSLKRIDSATEEYHFMTDDEAQAKVDSLMHRGVAKEAQYPQIFTVERPNIVVILLESFSAHGIEYLGGINATPNLDAIRHEGITFTNFFASADRSGKGLLAVFCGQPSLPNLRIIQYPEKTQALPQIAREMRRIGYTDQTFVYAGDINFNNFNSLVNLAGFDKVVTQDDFSSEQLGDKWGAHDEYSLSRLIEIMDSQTEPFYDFIFTLSSHEPFTVPMERKLEDDYLNSMCYTDKCLGEFFKTARTKQWWDKTAFILLADHGHGGPEHVGPTDRRRWNIPLIITGGAVATKDTTVTTYGSQTDLACTLLSQVGGETSSFRFSKNLLDSSEEDFAFFDFAGGYGFATPTDFEVYDNEAKRYVRKDDQTEKADTLSGKAYLQVVAKTVSEY